jgi:signal transduction histidine kinase
MKSAASHLATATFRGTSRLARFPSRRHSGAVIFSILLLLLLLLWGSTYQSIQRDREESLATLQSRLDAVNYALFAQIESSLSLIGLLMDSATPDTLLGSSHALPVVQALWVDRQRAVVVASLRPGDSSDRDLARQAALATLQPQRFVALPRPGRPDALDVPITLVRESERRRGILQVVVLDHQRLIRPFEALLRHVTTLRLYAGEAAVLAAQISGGAQPAQALAPHGALVASHGPGAHGLRVESTYPLAAALEPYGERTADRILTALLANALLIAIALFALRLTGYLRQYGLQLEMGRMHAEQASQIKTRFISQISHELRTPLHGIIGYADLIRQESGEAAQREHAAAILHSGQHLLSLVNRLLDAAKLETRHKVEAGEDALTLVPIDLVPVVQQTVFAHEATARQKSLATYVNAPTSLTVIADHVALGRILHNLLSNAIKFTLKGGIRVEVQRRPGCARIEVIDTGIGISAEDQTRLFGMFVQGASVDLSRFGGTGLGLYLTRQLVEGMGGRIGFQSALNTGSTFWFELPLAETPSPQSTDRSPR